MATEATKAIEAILMVAQEPVDPHLLAQLLEVSPARVDELCHELQVAYLHDDRGFVLVKVAGGYRFQSHADMAPYVERFVLEGQTARLSSAALETLAIVAYKQPISRAQVAAVRGVNVDGVMRTLQQRGYIDEVGRDPGPGQATLFGTTREFLERLGLDSLHDLPPLADLFPNADVLEALELGLRAEPAQAPATGDVPDAEPDDAADTDPTDTDPTPGPPDGDGPEERSEVRPADAPPAGEPELPAWFTDLPGAADTTDTDNTDGPSADTTHTDPAEAGPVDRDPSTAGEQVPGHDGPDTDAPAPSVDPTEEPTADDRP